MEAESRKKAFCTTDSTMTFWKRGSTKSLSLSQCFVSANPFPPEIEAANQFPINFTKNPLLPPQPPCLPNTCRIAQIKSNLLVAEQNHSLGNMDQTNFHCQDKIENRRTEERWLLNKLWTNFLKFWEMLTYMCKLTKISEGLCRVSKISVGLYIRTNLLGGQTFAKIHNKCQRRQSTMWPNCWLRQHNKVFWIFF